MHDNGSLNPRTLLVEARSLLSDGGYGILEDTPIASSLSEPCFVAEDAYGVVLVVVFSTWISLQDNWREAQAALVKLMSDRLTRGNPKASEGYLVLLTPSASDDERAEDEIRYDTSRLRKIVGTGESIRFTPDVRSVLMPLLPLDVPEATALEGVGSVLDHLPDMLVGRGIKRQIATAVVEAFRADEPLLESVRKVLRP